MKKLTETEIHKARKQENKTPCALRVQKTRQTAGTSDKDHTRVSFSVSSVWLPLIIFTSSDLSGTSHFVQVSHEEVLRLENNLQ